MKIIYQYRSKKDKSNLEARLVFSRNKKQVSFYTKTQIEVEKDFWDKINGYVYKKKVDESGNVVKDKQGNAVLLHDRDAKKYGKPIIFKDTNKGNAKTALESELNNLKKFIQENFNKTDLDDINKDWFKNVVAEYYNPKPDKGQTIPTDILGFFGYYLATKETEIKQKSTNTWRNWKVIEGKLQKFLNGKVVQIKDVNAKFRDKWQKHFFEQGYAATTIKKDFRYIKQVCAKAIEYDIETYHAIDRLEIDLTDEAKNLPIVYLTIDELKKIKAVKDLPPYLDNARDWLLISCFTGQRISDFMRFDKSMIFYKDGKPFIEIRQKKTGKEVPIPLLEPVLNILEKRKGDFPKPISDQRYNDYIKEVAKLAGLDEMIRGRLKIDNRRVIGNFPKWKLISSHTGRRSFASNFYKKISIVTLKKITGHYREDTFLTYIGEKTDYADAKDYDAMTNANINI